MNFRVSPNSVNGGVDKASDVIDWLENNIGKMHTKNRISAGFSYSGDGWEARWHAWGSGWFMDIEIQDPKLAAFYILRWK